MLNLPLIIDFSTIIFGDMVNNAYLCAEKSVYFTINITK